MDFEKEGIDEDKILREQVTRGLLRLPEELDDEENKDNADKIRIVLGEAYENTIKVLKRYVELREEYYPLLTVWIMGTYIHKSFDTYPYLFINAMRGSGKTRVLKLIEALAYNGELISSLKESVLFRDCKDKTLLIDEFEGIMSKDNQSLRELLNAGYKKGNKVKRMKKVRKVDGETYEVETFDMYVPICMANIWGVEEVLADRCVTLILEKSNNPTLLRLVEDFSRIPEVLWAKRVFLANLVQLCSYFAVVGINTKWNCFIINLDTLTTQTTYTTQTTLQNDSILLNSSEIEIFQRIYATNIMGRDLELMLPLLLTARIIGDSVFEDILKIATNLTKEKKKEEMTESRDVMVFDFVSRQTFNDFISIKELTFKFREFIGNEEGDEKWVNDRWFGRALKRLSLILDKRRVSHGIDVRLNISKANEKIIMFKEK